MDLIVDCFISTPMKILAIEFNLFGYSVSLFNVLIFSFLAGLFKLLIEKIFG